MYVSDAIIITISSIDYIVLCIDDWQCDQLRWSNQSVQKLPRKDPTIKQSYFFLFLVPVDHPNCL